MLQSDGLSEIYSITITLITYTTAGSQGCDRESSRTPTVVSWWRSTKASGRLPPRRLRVSLCRPTICPLLPHFRQTCHYCRLRRFDPLSLASEKKALTWFQQAELVHCRTAMTAVAGIIIPGVCTELHLKYLPLKL